MFNMQTHVKKENHQYKFIYYTQAKGEFTAILKHATLFVVLSTKCHLFRNFTSFCSNNRYFIHHALKCKYCPVHLKVNSKFEISYSDGVLKVQSFALVHPVSCWTVESWDV